MKNLSFKTIIISFIILAPVFYVSAAIVPCGRGTADPCTLKDLIVLISNIITFLIKDIAIPVAVVSFVWAGWLYLTAGGNTGQIEEAHRIFRWVILGLLLALGAWLIVKGITSALLSGSYRDVNPL